MAESPLSRAGSSGNGIYTVLLAIAFVALLLGVGAVWYRFAALFGDWNPFNVAQASVEAIRTTFLT